MGQPTERCCVRVSDQAAARRDTQSRGLLLQRPGKGFEVGRELDTRRRIEDHRHLSGASDQWLVVVPDLAEAARYELHTETSTIVRIGLSPDEPGPLEPIKNARDRPGGEACELGQTGGCQARFEGGQVETAQVGRVDPETIGDGLVRGHRSGDQRVQRAVQAGIDA